MISSPLNLSSFEVIFNFKIYTSEKSIHPGMKAHLSIIQLFYQSILQLPSKFQIGTLSNPFEKQTFSDWPRIL